MGLGSHADSGGQGLQKKETGINVNLVNTGQGNKTWDEFYQDAKKIHALGDTTTSRPTPVSPASTTR